VPTPAVVVDPPVAPTGTVAPSTEDTVAPVTADGQPSPVPAPKAKRAPRKKKTVVVEDTEAPPVPAESGDETDDDSSTKDDARQPKVNTSDLMTLVVKALDERASEVSIDASDRERKFHKAWTPLTAEQKTIIASVVNSVTFEISKAKVCDGYSVAFNGLITLKASCQLARKWLSPPTSKGVAAEIGDRLRARFSICEDLKRKLAEAPVPERLREKAVVRKAAAAAKLAAKAVPAVTVANDATAEV
jgi:hypothetical protein